MTKFVLEVEGDHAKLTANGLVVYETSIGTKPPPEPTPTPAPTPAPSRGAMTPRDYSIFAGIHGDNLAAIKAKFERYGLTYPLGWDWEDALASGAFVADRAEAPANPSKSGFDLVGKGNWVRNNHAAGFTYRYFVPTVKGENVLLQIAETIGTGDGTVTSSVHSPSGEVLSGPTKSSTKLTVHTLTSPGGRLTFFVMPDVTGPLVVQRN